MQHSDHYQELICIICPRGCRLTAETGQNGELEINGNSCPRGIEYARQELTAPMRVLTALMRLQDMEKPVSVKTDRPVPKALLFDCVAEIYRTHPAPPVHRGDVLIQNICGTGCNVVATRDAIVAAARDAGLQ